PNSGSVFTCATGQCASGAAIEVASGRVAPLHVGVDATNVYWIEVTGADGPRPWSGSIYTCPRGGCSGPPTPVVLNQPDVSGAFAVGLGSVYWDSAGALYLVSK